MAFTRALGISTVLVACGAALLAPGCTQDAPDSKLHGQVQLTLIHTADIHSRLFPYNLQIGQIDAGLGLGAANTVANIGGVARMSHIIGRERARAGRALHLDGGDCFQGAPIFNFYKGEAEVRALSAIGTDAMVVANHEFDTGAKNLGTQLQNWATFPVLAANYELEDPKLPGASPLGTIFKPYTVLDADGLRVGVIGMANLSTLSSIFDSPNRLGITPLNTTQIAQAYVDLIRPEVDLVVVLSHLGLDVDEGMIQSTTGIDIVLGGHNHIVLQPPKHVQDCSQNFDKETNSYYILVDGPEPNKQVRRYCKPRDVILAHSGAFAKFVGRLDLLLSNDPKDLSADYDPLNGFEVLSNSYTLFPVNENTPEDPIVSQVLEPYHQGLDSLANLDLLVGYAPDGSKRASPTGGDSALGNLIADAMWLRLGIQTDFSLTNTTGIRADLVPGPVTIEQMYNIFPFDNSITKMQLSGVELQDLFDFVARRSSGRGCVSQIQIAGARLVIDCKADNHDAALGPGKTTGIYIGAAVDGKGKIVQCQSDADCPGAHKGACDTQGGICWQPIDSFGYYDLATSNYLAGGGSGFRVLQRNTTQLDTQVQQRDALIDYLRAGIPCGASPNTKGLRTCVADTDCVCVPGQDPDLCNVEVGTYACGCPEAVLENDTCDPSGAQCKGHGKCILAACRADVAAFQRSTCLAGANDSIIASCEKSLAPCAAAGEQCKFLACVDKGIGNTTDGRLDMSNGGGSEPTP